MTGSERRVAVSTLLPLRAVLMQRGISDAQWLRPIGYTAEQLRDPMRRLSEDQLAQVWNRAIELTNDPALAVHTARVVNPAAFGILGHVLANATTLGQVLNLLQRFHRLLFDAPLLDIQFDRQHLSLGLQRDDSADPDRNRPLVEFTLISLLRLAMLLSAGEELASRYLHRVQFRHARPAAPVLNAYELVFGSTPIQFGAPRSAVVIDAAVLQLPVAYSDPQTFELLRQQAQDQLRLLSTETDPITRARACIRRRLLGRAPTIQDVAADCSTSRATLQRRLSAAGTSFRELLDEERRQSACELLREGQSIDDVAHLLGYGDSAAFQHAFKRWMGISAGAWRAEQKI